MSYQFYLVLHLVGVFLTLLPLGGIALHVMNGGTRDYRNRKSMAILHGTGLLVVLVAGFGLLARLGIITSYPTWVIVKWIVWFALGAMPVLFYRKARMARALLLLTLVLAGTAAAMAVYKPMLGGGTAEETSVPEDQPPVGEPETPAEGN